MRRMCQDNGKRRKFQVREREVLAVKCSSIQVSKNLKDPVNRQSIN